MNIVTNDVLQKESLLERAGFSPKSNKISFLAQPVNSNKTKLKYCLLKKGILCERTLHGIKPVPVSNAFPIYVNSENNPRIYEYYGGLFKEQSGKLNAIPFSESLPIPYIKERGTIYDIVVRPSLLGCQTVNIQHSSRGVPCFHAKTFCGDPIHLSRNKAVLASQTQVIPDETWWANRAKGANCFSPALCDVGRKARLSTDLQLPKWNSKKGGCEQLTFLAQLSLLDNLMEAKKSPFSLPKNK